jgi:hypothetical protein
MARAEAPREQVNHPNHYGGKDNPYEAIKVIEAWGLDFCLGNAVKYIARAGKKDTAKEVEDLQKAAWYLARRIEQIRRAPVAPVAADSYRYRCPLHGDMVAVARFDAPVPTCPLTGCDRLMVVAS